MSYTVTLQTNLSEDNKVDKKVNTIKSTACIFKNDCDIINPVITVNTDIKTLKNCNYFTIAETGRSYFVSNNGLVSIRNGVTEIHGHCDVLSSHKAELRSNTAIIKRNENLYNLYLDDGSFKTYNTPYIVTKKFPSGFNTFSQFVLVVAGGS